MLYISEGNYLQFLEVDEKVKLTEFFNKKRFTVSDSPLSYRQVNTMDNDGLLESRKDSSKWRKFSFLEIVYLMLVSELKKFGFGHEQLKELWKAFLREPNQKEPDISKHYAEVALGLVFGQIEIMLSISSGGEIAFYDPVWAELFLDNSKPKILIRINDYVNKIQIASGMKPTPITVTQASISSSRDSVSSKEEKLLEIVRNQDYTGVKIKKKDGEISVIYAERNILHSEQPSPKDIIKLIEGKGFQDISILKRDGKIVNYKVEESIRV